jgi:hypothetical protein
MTERGKLLQAEADLESLISRIKSALPILRRSVDDARGQWQTEIRGTIVANLEESIQNAETHQLERKR